MRTTSTSASKRRKTPLKRLIADASGLALIEFAYVTPFFLALTMGGLELGNYMIVKRRVGDIAAQLADNASRMGAQDGLDKVNEIDINDAFIGAQLHGAKLNLAANSRIILSSLQRNPSGGQMIGWQRCFGAKPYASSYGVQGDGAVGVGIGGMGPAGAQVKAPTNGAVMFVEIAYTYKPIVPLAFFSGTNNNIVEIASFTVREDRDLSRVYNPSPAAPVSSCT